jgi:hypothetical protein
MAAPYADFPPREIWFEIPCAGKSLDKELYVAQHRSVNVSQRSGGFLFPGLCMNCGSGMAWFDSCFLRAIPPLLEQAPS